MGNGEIEKMVTRLKSIDQKAVENHVNGAVWAFDYDKMFCVLMENEICRKVCEKNKYNSWTKMIVLSSKLNTASSVTLKQVFYSA